MARKRWYRSVLTYNEGKSVDAERFTRTLKNELQIYDFNIKKVHVDKVDDLVNRYSNTYHQTIKMKLVDVKSKTYIQFNRENNNKVCNHVTISKHKDLAAKGHVPNWSVKVFVIEEIKNNVTWAYINGDLNGEKIIGKFYKKELQKTNQK